MNKDQTGVTQTQPAEREPDRERVVRVFISSTFKDMIVDRNELKSLAIEMPKLGIRYI
jgi:hypothetical protein